MIQFLTNILGLCKQYRGSVTSWIRSHERNAQVKGHPDSLHIPGHAVDIHFESEHEMLDFEKKVKRLHYTTYHISKTNLHVQMY